MITNKNIGNMKNSLTGAGGTIVFSTWRLEAFSNEEAPSLDREKALVLQSELDLEVEDVSRTNLFSIFKC